VFSELRQVYKESNGAALLAHFGLAGIVCLGFYGVDDKVRDSSLRGALPNIIDYANHCGNIDPSIGMTAVATTLAGVAANVIAGYKPSRKVAAIAAGIGAAVGIGCNVAVEVEPFAHVVAPFANDGKYSGGDLIDLGYGTVTSLATSVLLARVLARKPEGYEDPLCTETSAAEVTSIPDLTAQADVLPAQQHPPID
jgi:hypothetical protein